MMRWTAEQERVISLRNSSILVSAAAGSGKTAVLVQRILSRLTDPVNPSSIDRMLIMTFTRAAAGEMKERIQRAVEEALMKDPGNARLQKQLTLIPMAQITTIDGFCGWILRNYFHLIGLDPGYRIGDEGEMVLMKQDVLKAVLEEFHKEGSPGFLHMLECFCTGRSDDSIKEDILRIYDRAMSTPDPEKYLEDCLAGFSAGNPEELRELPWMQGLFALVSSDLAYARELLLKAASLCRAFQGPWHYEDGILECLEYVGQLENLAKRGSFDDLYSFLSCGRFPELSRKRPKDVDESLKKEVSELRKKAREILTDLKEGFFFCDTGETLRTMEISRESVEVLLSVVRRFMEAFSERKRGKNILDFTDMEHLALSVLSPREGEEGGSAAARELSEKFDEVMIDEYQDSNLIQERIAGYVSGWVQKKDNLFMVGDVKQSIYRFRLARPELFMEKYHRYSREDGPCVRIDLHRNFRSRPEILSCVNYIFRRIMGSDLGGIAYGEEEELYPGAEFPEGQEKDSAESELLLVREPEEARTPHEAEAMAVAARIQEMVGHERIYDREEDRYRPVRYGDIAVLLRSFSGWSETFMEVLTSRGIPAYALSRSGYFQASEVAAMLNYLRILDNPRQDIPLAGVLRSPIAGCSDEELALLRAEYREGLLYDSVKAFLAEKGDEHPGLYAKLQAFHEELLRFRERAVFLPVHQLIREILRDTGYGMIVKAMPNGEQRNANLAMLAEKALEYEKTSYHGLFHFIRYVENLHRYDVDYGEVNLSGAGDGAVQLMTVHKSKGLEFPVVFVSGLSKQFNFMDANASILVDADLGIAPDAVLPERNLRVPSLKKRLTREHIVSENIGEELRIFYVALTRAKEKLIMTGEAASLQKQLSSLMENAGRQEDLLPLRVRRTAKSWMDFLLPALSDHSCMLPVLREMGLDPEEGLPSREESARFQVRLVEVQELVSGEVSGQARSLGMLRRIKEADPEETVDPEIRQALEERFSWQYPFGILQNIPVKVTVSELKKRSYHEEEERESILKAEEVPVPLVPRFLAGEEEEDLRGSERGTAYHRLMECLDYAEASSEEELKNQLLRLMSEKKMSEAQASCIRLEEIRAFLESDLGKRMGMAFRNGTLFREQPFMTAVRASKLDPAWEAGEDVLVQGIVDAYFFEEEEIVLVDYKTDRVPEKGGEEKLRELYHIQLEDYAGALHRLTGRKVKERKIWSFALQRAVEV